MVSRSLTMYAHGTGSEAPSRHTLSYISTRRQVCNHPHIVPGTWDRSQITHKPETPKCPYCSVGVKKTARRPWVVESEHCLNQIQDYAKSENLFGDPRPNVRVPSVVSPVLRLAVFHHHSFLIYHYVQGIYKRIRKKRELIYTLFYFSSTVQYKNMLPRPETMVDCSICHKKEFVFLTNHENIWTENCKHDRLLVTISQSRKCYYFSSLDASHPSVILHQIH